MKKSIYIVHSAVIAAIYIALTWAFAPISFGHNIFQLRVSEALCILPLFTPGAVFGLFAGCFLSNLLFGGLGIIEVWQPFSARRSHTHCERKIRLLQFFRPSL